MDFTLLLLSSLLLSARAAGASDAVLDTDGNKVQRAQPYYVTSAMRPGGGLALAARNESCPLYVAQTRFNDRRGRPLAFFPENPNDDTLKEGRTLYIMFPQPTRCSESTVWKVEGASVFVTTGGTTSTAIGPVDSRFAIRKVGDFSPPTYQIQLCPCSVGAGWPSCRMGCLGTLGLVGGRIQAFIGLNSNRPHTVHFVKVKTA